MDRGLRLQDVRLSKDATPLLALDAKIAPGDVLTLMGPSGSGKSTLLSYVMGDLPPAFAATGAVRLDGHDILTLPTDKRRISILYQDPLLFPHLDVATNLAFGLPRTVPRAKRRAMVDAALADVDLDGFGPRDPASLSGGQAARVALMRVLLAGPAAVLLDEPFSKLDANLRDRMRSLVFDRVRDAAIPALLVTHDEDDARAAGGQVIRL
ncbi:MAG: ATP-binding cassette domain-containing protein [Pseudomonadota bacterium]